MNFVKSAIILVLLFSQSGCGVVHPLKNYRDSDYGSGSGPEDVTKYIHHYYFPSVDFTDYTINEIARYIWWETDWTVNFDNIDPLVFKYKFSLITNHYWIPHRVIEKCVYEYNEKNRDRIGFKIRKYGIIDVFMEKSN